MKLKTERICTQIGRVVTIRCTRDKIAKRRPSEEGPGYPMLPECRS